MIVDQDVQHRHKRTCNDTRYTSGVVQPPLPALLLLVPPDVLVGDLINATHELIDFLYAIFREVDTHLGLPRELLAPYTCKSITHRPIAARSGAVTYPTWQLDL